MKKPLLHLILCTALVLPYAACAPGATETGTYDKAIGKYVQFLQQQKQTPVDYIVNLFQTYDLVVLCERSHPEVTQYDMVYELAADKRFQQQAGHIFMENGTPTLRPVVESFLVDDTLTEAQAQEKLRHIFRDFNWDGKWDAAFAVLGYPSLGFDFQGSPFGSDEFDYFAVPFPIGRKYQEIFTGYVFYKPLDEHRMTFAIPGLLDPSFAGEMLKRCQIKGENRSAAQIAKEIEQSQTVRTCGYENKEMFPKSEYARKIQQWLTAR